jgi:4'-phosphopantetheinyl transferase
MPLRCDPVRTSPVGMAGNGREEHGTSWQPAGGPPVLEGEEVHRVSHVLSPDECERAACFLRPEDRHRFVWTRAVLRMLLAGYLRTEPDEVRLTYGRYGKPALQGEGGPAFNVSHSGNVALIAVAPAGAVGVDVEKVRDVDLAQVARHVYAPAEQAAAAALPPALRTEAFFRCWTRKEAWLKARGDGLAVDPTTFSVPLGPVRAFELLHREAPALSPARWTIWDVAVGDGYQGAVAIPGTGRALRGWDWA